MKNNKKTSWQKLQEEWINVITAILDPVVLLLLIVAIGLLFFSYKQVDNDIISAIFTITISLLVALVSTIFVNKYKENNENTILTAKGNDAIRNLKMLLSNIHDLEEDILKYSNDENSKNNLKIYFEEILRKLKILRKEGINAIESWSDLIPNTNITTQLEIFEELQGKERKIDQKVQQLETELSDTRKKSEGEKSNIKKELCDTKKELKNVKSELDQKNLIVSPFLGVDDHHSSSIGLNANLENFSSSKKKICSQCGNEYIDFFGINDKCENCNSQNLQIDLKNNHENQ
jgi:hypothetical protein